MPLIKYKCSDCQASFSSVYRKASDIANSVVCKICGGQKAVRVLSAPASVSKIIVDNGIQARAVEVVLDVIESNKEMSQKGPNRGN